MTAVVRPGQPAVELPKRPRTPTVATRRLASGLELLAVRRSNGALELAPSVTVGFDAMFNEW